MPKVQKRRKAPAKTSTAQSRVTNAPQVPTDTRKRPEGTGSTTSTSTTGINRRLLSPAASSPQNLIFSAMVALGCWLMAFTLIFLTSDPNRYLLGGMAVLIALLWSFMFGMRLRKLLQVRQGSRL